MPSLDAMRILGIDPGLCATGFGVIDHTGDRLIYVASGTIRTQPRTSTRKANPQALESTDSVATITHAIEIGLPERLKTILQGLQEVLDTYRPDAVAIEKVFVNVNPQSTLLLGQARGAAISAVVLRDLPVAEYTALQIKQSVVGNGHAQKTQVQAMVKRLLNLPAAPKSDSADALACAICHAHGGHGLGSIATMGFRVRAGRLV